MGDEGMEVWELPTGWEVSLLGEVCEINPTRPRLSRDDDEPTSFVPMAAVYEGRGVIADLQARSYRKVKRGYTYFEEEDVLFAKITPSMQNGKSAIARGLIDGLGFGSTEFHVLRPSSRVIPEWVHLFVRQRSFRDEAMRHFRGAVGQQRVPGEFLESHPFPLPPLDEQRRIVARIEELFARIEEARRLRTAADQDAERLMPAAMRGVFTFNGELPAGWEWKTVKEVGDTERVPVQTGPFGAQLKSSEFVDTGVPVLAIGNVQWGYLDTSDLKHVTPQKADRLSRYRVKAGDILFTRMGTVGRSCLVPPEADDWLISYHLLRVAVDKRRCKPKYLSYCFRGAPQIEEQIEQRSRGATRAGVNTTILADLRFPAAPLAEQRRIVEYLDGVQAQVAELQRLQAESGAELERLSGAVLARAFRGEL